MWGKLSHYYLVEATLDMDGLVGSAKEFLGMDRFATQLGRNK
jgi:hypothetical protein